MVKNKDIVFHILCYCANRIKIRVSGAKRLSNFQAEFVCSDCGKLHSIKSYDMVNKRGLKNE